MSYYQLNTQGTNWIPCEFNAAKRQIFLFDDDLALYGIGLY